jgi:hypothetical protein
VDIIGSYYYGWRQRMREKDYETVLTWIWKKLAGWIVRERGRERLFSVVLDTTKTKIRKE